MYPIFALWVRSHKDLPLNVYQIVNTFRYETKTTRPFLRVREIHFFEETPARSQRGARLRTGPLRTSPPSDVWPRRSACPTCRSADPNGTSSRERTSSIALDIPIGRPARSRPGACDHYRDNFDLDGIRHEASDGSRSHVHQTTFGLSERLLGAHRRGRRRLARRDLPEPDRAVPGGHRPHPEARGPRRAGCGDGRARGPPLAGRRAGLPRPRRRTPRAQGRPLGTEGRPAPP